MAYCVQITRKLGNKVRALPKKKKKRRKKVIGEIWGELTVCVNNHVRLGYNRETGVRISAEGKLGEHNG